MRTSLRKRWADTGENSNHAPLPVVTSKSSFPSFSLVTIFLAKFRFFILQFFRAFRSGIESHKLICANGTSLHFGLFSGTLHGYRRSWRRWKPALTREPYRSFKWAIFGSKCSSRLAQEPSATKLIHHLSALLSDFNANHFLEFYQKKTTLFLG